MKVLTNTTVYGIIVFEVRTMEYRTTGDAVQKWNISERRIRQLLTEGRIEGAIKIGGNWNIPVDAEKPLDKRIMKPDNNNFIIDIKNSFTV